MSQRVEHNSPNEHHLYMVLFITNGRTSPQCAPIRTQSALARGYARLIERTWYGWALAAPGLLWLVLVSGLVVGNITAGARLEVTAEGRVVGNVSTPVLVLQEGARVRGSVEMPEVEAAMAAPRPEPVIQLTTPKKDPVTAPRLEPVQRLEPVPRPGRRTSVPPPAAAAAMDEAAVDAILDSPPLGTQPMTADGGPAAPRQSLATPLTDAEAAAALDIPEIEILDDGILSVTTTPPD